MLFPAFFVSRIQKLRFCSRDYPGSLPSGEGLIQASPVKPKPEAAVLVSDDTAEGRLGLCVGARPVGLPVFYNPVRFSQSQSVPGQVLPLVNFDEKPTGRSGSSAGPDTSVAENPEVEEINNKQSQVANEGAPKTPPNRTEQDFADEVSQLTADYQKALKAAKSVAPRKSTKAETQAQREEYNQNSSSSSSTINNKWQSNWADARDDKDLDWYRGLVGAVRSLLVFLRLFVLFGLLR